MAWILCFYLPVLDLFKLDEMLRSIYYLYHNSPKKWRELKRLPEAFEESIVKPARSSHGSRWAARKLRALKAIIRSYVSRVGHMEDMSSGERSDI